MSVLTTILLIVGILALIEGFMAVFTKYSLRMLKKFNRSTEKHIKTWGVIEIIIAITLIVLGLVL